VLLGCTLVCVCVSHSFFKKVVLLGCTLVCVCVSVCLFVALAWVLLSTHAYVVRTYDANGSEQRDPAVCACVLICMSVYVYTHICMCVYVCAGAL
jgi:hypothetical protein